MPIARYCIALLASHTSVQLCLQYKIRGHAVIPPLLIHSPKYEIQLQLPLSYVRFVSGKVPSVIQILQIHTFRFFCGVLSRLAPNLQLAWTPPRRC